MNQIVSLIHPSVSRSADKLTAFIEGNEGLLSALRNHNQLPSSDFRNSIVSQLNQKLWLSPKQVECFVRAVEKDKQFAHARQQRDELRKQEQEAILANGGALPVGRSSVEGKVISVKLKETQFGESLKWLILLDNGCKVWGSVPSNIVGQAPNKVTTYDYTDAEGNIFAAKNFEFPNLDERVSAYVVGKRVRFTATVEASPKDVTFGFASRPTKGEVLG